MVLVVINLAIARFGDRLYNKNIITSSTNTKKRVEILGKFSTL